MRGWSAWLILILGAALLNACSSASPPTTERPPGPTPLAPATPDHGLALEPSATPSVGPQISPSPSPQGAPRTWHPVGTPVRVTEEPGLMTAMPTTEAILTAAQADAEGLEPQEYALYHWRAELNGTILYVWGTKPTPCHRVVADIQTHGQQLQVRLYTRRAPGMCIEGLQDVAAQVDLRPYLPAQADTPYQVIVNGQPVGILGPANE